MVRLILIVSVVAAIAYVVSKIFRGFGTIFRIDIRNGRAEIRGTVPGHAWSDVRAFLRELPLPDRCHIVGIHEEPRFRLQFSSNIAEGVRQRIRNYLYL